MRYGTRVVVQRGGGTSHNPYRLIRGIVVGRVGWRWYVRLTEDDDTVFLERRGSVELFGRNDIWPRSRLQVAKAKLRRLNQCES